MTMRYGTEEFTEFVHYMKLWREVELVKGVDYILLEGEGTKFTFEKVVSFTEKYVEVQAEAFNYAWSSQQDTIESLEDDLDY